MWPTLINYHILCTTLPFFFDLHLYPFSPPHHKSPTVWKHKLNTRLPTSSFNKLTRMTTETVMKTTTIFMNANPQLFSEISKTKICKTHFPYSCREAIRATCHQSEVKIMEDAGIDPAASRMLSEHSTIWANPPDELVQCLQCPKHRLL